MDGERRVELGDLIVAGPAPKQREGTSASGHCRGAEIRGRPSVFVMRKGPCAEDRIAGEAEHVAVVLGDHVDEPVMVGGEQTRISGSRHVSLRVREEELM